MPALQQRRHLSCVCLVEPALGSGASPCWLQVLACGES